MSHQYTLDAIGYVHTCFPEKFGIPRQPLLAPRAKGVLVLNPSYGKDCLQGLEDASHLWLQFIFHQHRHWQPKVRPPRLGGNKKVGVFSSRSPFRPNALGLSVVKLDSIRFENHRWCLHLAGLDLLDGTPVVDIKPYVPYVDCLNEATYPFADTPAIVLVDCSAQVKRFCQQYHCPPGRLVIDDLQQLIVDVLQQDPRPAYHRDKQRIYYMRLLDCELQWRACENGRIEVIDICYWQKK